MVPVALGLAGGGGGNSPGGRERSSGAPSWRPFRSGASEIGGGGSVAAVLVPSCRGAPGALGLVAGSNASPRRIPATGGGSTGAGNGAGAAATTGGGTAAAGGGSCAAGRGATAAAGGVPAPNPRTCCLR